MNTEQPVTIVSANHASSPSRMLHWIMAAMVLTMLFICVNEPGYYRRTYA